MREANTNPEGYDYCPNCNNADIWTLDNRWDDVVKCLNCETEWTHEDYEFECHTHGHMVAI